MNAAAKLLEAMRRNPLDWRIEQLQTVARRTDLEVRCEGGSHHVFSHPEVTDVVSVPEVDPSVKTEVRLI